MKKEPLDINVLFNLVWVHIPDAYSITHHFKNNLLHFTISNHNESKVMEKDYHINILETYGADYWTFCEEVAKELLDSIEKS